ncbi:carbon monoxide dehydrogenase [Streptomyces sp. NPDC048566]|uniref:carbon monoxide dehydrogenase n=1 Tax=Streptomyces sp. NPDC048566 TaxID=3365569 RepID=UPI003724231B
MEHEVFVPFPAGPLREALADPVRVARAVPGLQQDASADPGEGPSDKTPAAAGGGQDADRGAHPRPVRVAGRLKVRVAGHTITYRGALAVTARDDGAYAVEGDGTEVRGGGAVKLALTLRLVPAEGGTSVVYGGTASADGRVAGLPRDPVVAAAHRLLTRFTLALTGGPRADDGDAQARPPAPEARPGDREPGSRAARRAGSGAGAAAEEPGGPGGPEEEVSGPGGGRGAGAEPGAGRDRSGRDAPEGAEPAPGADPSALFGPEGPPSPLDPTVEGADLGAFGDFGAEAFGEDGEPGEEDAMAEAAHARRTMIGRSAEEVDHAPPRGRYAPVPPPEATAARATLRWAAPAAALAVASAIAVTRVLRRRR